MKTWRVYWGNNVRDIEADSFDTDSYGKLVLIKNGEFVAIFLHWDCCILEPDANTKGIAA